MSYAYDQRKRTAPKVSPKASRTSSAPGPSMEAIAAGLARPSTQQMGHRVDLPEAMRQKMENAFGTDFSAVRLFESQTVADAGAEAITQGNQVAFAPGKLDFSSQEGQARLGHELSHVASQARGESTGRGFLLDSGLEHQADREGAMAAAGQTVYSGPVTHALSSSSPSPAAAGVMQASRGGLDPNDDVISTRTQERLNGTVGSGIQDPASITDTGSFPPLVYQNDEIRDLMYKKRNFLTSKNPLAPPRGPGPTTTPTLAKKKKWFSRK